MTLQEAIRHAGSLEYVPGHIVHMIRDHMPGYLWITPAGTRRRTVRCEACEREWTEVAVSGRYEIGYHQGQARPCPSCGASVVPKYVKRGYQTVNDRLNVTWYMKSHADPEAIVVFGAHCQRFFLPGRPPWEQPPLIEIRSLCVVTPGEGAHRFKREPRDWQINGYMRPSRFEWVPVKRLGHMTFGATSMFRQPAADQVDLNGTLRGALRGTTIGRGWHDGLTGIGLPDCVTALHLVAKYPCCEYLTKLGMGELMEERLTDDLPSGLINWRGRKLTDVLRMTPQRWGELKHAGIVPTSALLATYRWLDGHGYHLTAPAARSLSRVASGTGYALSVEYSLDRLVEFHDPTRRQKALKYIARQAEKARPARIVANDFRDYWQLCQRYHEDMLQDATAFPSDIRAAENRLQERERRDRELEEARRNRETWAEQDARIARALPGLTRRFGFSYGGLTLRPAANGDEVRREGHTLHHCVASYVARYAEGSTVICVLRRDVDPDRPWRTVEINPKNGRIVQDRGYRNDSSLGIELTDNYRAALNLFWEAWNERETETRGRKTA